MQLYTVQSYNSATTSKRCISINAYKLQEDRGLTCGVIYMISDSWGKELFGYIVVTNPFDGRPVVVKILLRRTGDRIVKVDDLKFEELKFIHYKFLI